MVRPSVHVLNLRMVNLQVGHLRFLHELESPFTSSQPNQTTIDLLLAALVCSMDWRDAEKHIGRWYLKPFLRFWAWRCRKSNLVHEAARFRHYLSTSIETRKIKKANGGKALQAPLHQRLYLMLVEDIGHDPITAWDEQVRPAIDLWMARAEKEGALEFWSDRETAHFEAHQELNKRWMEEQETRTE